jgi:predicted ribosome quality control (RQC) complex YloA/Tae2 family protein
MRRYLIQILNKTNEIIAMDRDEAVDKMKAIIGLDPSKIVCVFTTELFNGIDDLHDRCKLVSHLNLITVVSIWTGKDSCDLEIARLDGYCDTIEFDASQKELAHQIYNELKMYNRKITPLEKFHASF